MIDPQSLDSLNREVKHRMVEDRKVLDELRAEIRPLRDKTRRIHPRSTTAISLVGTDGGNNRIEFDPFLVQLVRVVDSSNNEYCLEAVTPTTDIGELSESHFGSDGAPKTALGKLMAFVGVRELGKLSHMVRRNDPPNPSWVQVYRELTEWAILFDLVRAKDFGTDTVIVRDGFLRSKVFAEDRFVRCRQGITEAIEQKYQGSRRRLYVAGVAKHSKVLQRYRLAMALEGVMQHDYPCYVEVPRELEQKTYVWSEYGRGGEMLGAAGEVNKFVAGKMFLVKFGSRPRDPIWAIDLWESQAAEAQTVIGYLLADAINGFPVPFYPQCLQRAHENAALVDFDMDVLQQSIFAGIRESLGADAPMLDVFRLLDSDPSSARYGGGG